MVSAAAANAFAAPASCVRIESGLYERRTVLGGLINEYHGAAA